jgi:hypothetical protein
VARVRDEEESTTSLLRPLTATAPYRPVILGGRPTGVRIACNNGCAVPAVSPHRAEHEMASYNYAKEARLM